MVHFYDCSRGHVDRNTRCLFSRARRRENSSPRRNTKRLTAFFLGGILLLSSEWAHAFPTVKNLSPLKNPIVLVHGSTISGSNLTIGPFNLGAYFLGIPEFLSVNGTEVKVAQLPTDGSIAERAAVLKNFLETDMKGRMVNIVGHSLGGLDARYAVSVLKSMQIASITTIGTPHRGTPLADWALAQVENNGPWYWFFRLLGYDMKQRRFLQEITTYKMKTFNEQVPDSYEVRYFSVSTKVNRTNSWLSGFLWFPARWLEGQKHILSANGHDGMVPYDSQIWGKQLYSAGIDHLAQMNHHELRITDNREESLGVWYNIYENLQREGL